MDYSGTMSVACNPTAISAAQRPRYGDLVSRLHSAMEDSSELQDGFRYSLRPAEISVPEIAEWITMERLCCPFLTFQLEIGEKAFRLTMRGPDGAKAILREEFPHG